MRPLISLSWRPFWLAESVSVMIDQMGDAPLRNTGITLYLSKEVFKDSYHTVTENSAPIAMSQCHV